MGDLEQYEVRALRRDAEIDERNDREYAEMQELRKRTYRFYRDGVWAQVKIYPHPDNPRHRTAVHHLLSAGGPMETVTKMSYTATDEAIDAYDTIVDGYLNWSQS